MNILVMGGLANWSIGYVIVRNIMNVACNQCYIEGSVFVVILVSVV